MHEFYRIQVTFISSHLIYANGLIHFYYFSINRERARIFFSKNGKQLSHQRNIAKKKKNGNKRKQFAFEKLKRLVEQI